MDNKKVDVFNGSGDVVSFITKVELQASLKNYTQEKEAQYLASRLDGAAFDVYLRLDDEARKNPSTVKTELKKEFEKGNINRELAIHELSGRLRRPAEPPLTFAHKITELVGLAYATLDQNAKIIIAKDYFVKGLHPDMQVALKYLEKFASANSVKI